jgi:hypothetical protein
MNVLGDEKGQQPQILDKYKFVCRRLANTD